VLKVKTPLLSLCPTSVCCAVVLLCCCAVLPCVLLSPGEGTEDELKERQAKGMADPDVQNILMDPIMRQVLAYNSSSSTSSTCSLQPSVYVGMSCAVAAPCL
jgi:hypothetical protein